ncbi:MAG: putative pseudouridine synthase aq [Chlamydiota bacterium]
MEKKRLSKVLAAAGIASRRASEKLIFEGRVQVNGTTVLVPQTGVDPMVDEIRIDGSRVKSVESKVIYMLNKPKGVICSSVRVGRKPIILDLFPHSKERLFTVGRLDKETTGLILVTNDGVFANDVIHPSANIIKEYVVKAAQEVTGEHLETLAEGARVDNRWIRPVNVRKVRKGTVKIAVKEGKKHEVRLIAHRAGLDVLELTRIRIGNLTLGSLPLGKYRPLTEEDINAIFAR